MRAIIAAAVLLAAGGAWAQEARPLRLITPPPPLTPELLRALPASQGDAMKALHDQCSRWHLAADRNSQHSIEGEPLPATGTTPWVGRLLARDITRDHAAVTILLAPGLTLRSTGGRAIGSPGPDAGPARGTPHFTHFAQAAANGLVMFRPALVRPQFIGGQCQFTADFRAP